MLSDYCFLARFSSTGFKALGFRGAAHNRSLKYFDAITSAGRVKAPAAHDIMKLKSPTRVPRYFACCMRRVIPTLWEHPCFARVLFSAARPTGRFRSRPRKLYSPGVRHIRHPGHVDYLSEGKKQPQGGSTSYFEIILKVFGSLRAVRRTGGAHPEVCVASMVDNTNILRMFFAHHR